MAREDLHFRLRIPEELKNKIEAAAVEHRRSMTAEIVSRLEESVRFDELGEKVEGLRKANDPARRAYAEGIAAAATEARLMTIEAKLDQLLTDKAKK